MQKFGKFEVVREVGAGGFGKVYEGRDTVLKRRVAIKTCSSDDHEMQQRFLREAQVVAMLQHPNITTVHDLGEEDGVPYLVQEFLSGEDLSQVIKRGDPLPVETRIRYLVDIAKALEHAHEHGIIHRDIKPGNIRVLPNGSVKVMDFGIAKLAAYETKLTKTGMMIGTAGYLAPEQVRDEDVDGRADIFSFGVVAYEFLTYFRPFSGSTLSALLYQLVHQPHPPLLEKWPEAPPELAALIDSCLHKDPNGRPANFGSVLAQLFVLISDSGIDQRTRVLSTGSEPAPLSANVVRPGDAHTVKGGGSAAPPQAQLPSAVSGSANTVHTVGAVLPGPTTGVTGSSSRSFAVVPARSLAWVASLAALAAVIALLVVAPWRPRGAAQPPVPAPGAPSSSLASPALEPAATSPSSALVPGGSGPGTPASEVAANSGSNEPAESRAQLPATGRSPEQPTATRRRQEPAPTQRAAVGRTTASGAAPPIAVKAGSKESTARAAEPNRSVAEPSASNPAESVSRRPDTTANNPSTPTPSEAPARPAATTTTANAPALPRLDPAAEERAILAILQAYASAYRALDSSALKKVWPDLSGTQLDRIENSFAAVQAMKVDVNDCRIDLQLPRATAACSVVREITAKGGRKQNVAGKTDFKLIKRGENWVIENA